MMRFLVFLAFTALFTVAACSSEAPKEEAAETSESVFGAKFTPASILTVDELFPLITAEESAPVQVAGEVVQVCQTKGCWLTLQTSEGNSVRVTFKDYGFFVPKDIAGREVLMEGVSWKEVTSVEHQRHYLEDADASAEEIAAITEPKVSFYFEASGVVLL